ncbi:MAG: M28 family peptidase [Prevotellaceae bacterium]|nr:M28 family peptidase [Candidatus Minthosoma caballi]
MRKLLFVIAAALMVFGCTDNKPTETKYVSPAPAFNEDSAFQYVADQCAFGPRVMNSAAHDSCGDYIASKFASYGAMIYDQYADSKLYDGTVVKMRNIIAAFNPDAEDRILISGHWDSRPWADHDADEANHHTPIDGANDGGSCVGVMIEMARQLKLSEQKGDSAFFKLHPNLGIDFICWDAEDCGTPSFAEEDPGNTWCLGSQYWAGVRHKVGYTARYGVNLDMVGAHNTVFYKEVISMMYAPSIVDKVWAAAHRIGYGKYFDYTDKPDHQITDDHLQVNQGGIPCIDLIGSDKEGMAFPTTWHTINDNINNIDKNTLKAVGQTMLEVIWTE